MRIKFRTWSLNNIGAREIEHPTSLMLAKIHISSNLFNIIRMIWILSKFRKKRDELFSSIDFGVFYWKICLKFNIKIIHFLDVA